MLKKLSSICSVDCVVAISEAMEMMSEGGSPTCASKVSMFPEILTVHPSGAHEKTLIFLHGFRMKASELLEVFVDISRLLPTWKFVLPQAPEIGISSYSGERLHSWFDYLTDTGGMQEDTIDIFGLRSMKTALQDLVVQETTLLPPGKHVCLGGLSQGGCMALHVAAHMELMAVVTIVACRLSQSCTRALKCPWHAVVAANDDVFPLSWAQPLLAGATTIIKINDSHYLEQTDVSTLMLQLLQLT